jgi:LPXTG-motif cell wall-anchored protein
MLMGGLLVLASAAPGLAQQDPARCPPGQPPGRPPGRPPTQNPTPAAENSQRPNYPPGRCKLLLSQAFAARGGTFAASGDGFVPGERVLLTIAGAQVKSVIAGDDGTFSTTLAVPDSAPIGLTQVVATSDTQVLSAAFEVVASGAPVASDRAGSGLLPRTGSDVAMLGGAGAGLIGLGAAAVVAARRRRTTSA